MISIITSQQKPGHQTYKATLFHYESHVGKTLQNLLSLPILSAWKENNFLYIHFPFAWCIQYTK